MDEFFDPRLGLMLAVPADATQTPNAVRLTDEQIYSLLRQSMLYGYADADDLIDLIRATEATALRANKLEMPE